MSDSIATAVDLDTLCVNTMRTLAIDAVEQARSGHPGAPMALAPAAYALWTRVLRHNPKNPRWPDRDRFVLSNGHASMLQYAAMFLTGYELSLEELKRFRQWGSKTPGHPENIVTTGVETTTGPLGQGFMNAVGMAMAEAHLAARYNRPGHAVIDHHTYVFCGDGDMMEGASHEAASLAGHLRLGKLVALYDDNHITIEGSTERSFTEDVGRRFEAYGWRVTRLGERANDVSAIAEALERAREQTDRPTLIILRTHIGFGSPNRQDRSSAHGEPLGEEEVRLTKRAYGWPEEQRFFVPDEVDEVRAAAVARGERLEREWRQHLEAYAAAHAEPAAELEAALADELPAGWDAGLPRFEPGESKATRAVSAPMLNLFASRIGWLAGGSADLTPSTKTAIAADGVMAGGDYGHRNIAWGVREHAMTGAASGMALHGGVRPFTSTFFVFSDYARPAMRLAALMKLPVIYVMTHDSIGVGEDGPTHQPIEHLASFRAMPNMCVIRPADANEAVQAWRAAIMRQDGPTTLVLSRQGLPVLGGARLAGPEGLLKGAYVLCPERGELPQVVLIATGSEVHLALGAQALLADGGVDARVVSMPSWELFRAQPRAYRDEVLPPAAGVRLAVEAASPFGWCEWVGDAGDVIGIPHFGASAPAKELFARFGLTAEAVAARALELLGA